MIEKGAVIKLDVSDDRASEAAMRSCKDREIFNFGGMSFCITQVGSGCAIAAEVKTLNIPIAWTGDGLPPVGTVCEFCGGESDPFDPWHPELRDGAKVTVIAHYNNMGADVAVFTFADQREDVAGMQVEQAMAQCFRPIRTPQQIEADERKKDIENACSIIGCVVGSLYGDVVTKLIEAGYRKQPTQEATK